ncbi:putative cytochrome b6-f complex subunit [Crocosphaera subtropica ATCC 51142]|uniref:Cytochrome b6-f complex subunit 7 n=1 Tax=Crocosphaera subtropica (strain ATCC 51142 / BH68) TaxID=43989 RepID=PETM_CROS5|nr:PetM family cytochrome b6-f complex subunit 7 [Crocosphaera subtropica]B1WU77.1 RecName: Full=Cytochrome b6-f complex subunit 7; AltName: Full=Cytochrome b6-f complex subunit PetM; AltName: Full=Cytochrome b6-f complex subunit VII [Crocosphaera subtropica ATCC 51142]ACB52139.1 putative cytochrome b6-f complex subunit [Crocosphaera subtropica ATCC 51142]MDJ0598779.1 PetM family cytochrome b6-f complex subunit 7 [Crocosphaera sp.]
MTAESMMFNGAVILMVLVLFGLAWGFLILKIQGGEAE